MKVVNKREFLQLPKGTIYCQLDKDFTKGNIEIKGDSLCGGDEGYFDWFYYNLSEVEEPGVSNQFSLLENMLNKKLSIPLEFLGERDGMYESGNFLVYESDDVNLLIQALSNPSMLFE